MTDNESYLSDIRPTISRFVTFGNDGKGAVIGIGKMNVPGVPFLENVLLISDLLANFLSISQFSDGEQQVALPRIDVRF